VLAPVRGSIEQIIKSEVSANQSEKTAGKIAVAPAPEQPEPEPVPEPVPAPAPTVEDKHRAVFYQLDTDGSGGLAILEVAAGLVQLGLSNVDLQKMFAAADTDGNGEVDYEAFSEIITKSVPAGPEPKIETVPATNAPSSTDSLTEVIKNRNSV
jgi:hypothetical protein